MPLAEGLIGEPIVLDASVVISLLGSGAITRILSNIGQPVLLEKYVLAEIAHHPIPGRDATAELGRLQVSGTLEVVSMNEEAYLVYLELVGSDVKQALGAGESATLAIADQAGHMVAIDDIKARRVAASRFPNISALTTVQVIQHAAARGGFSDSEIREMLNSSLTHARMHVHERDRRWVLEKLK